MELFSQTKIITSIAALQLVDRGLVSLDNEEDIDKFLSEVQRLEILTGYGEGDKPEMSSQRVRSLCECS
jgi:methyl acetate hydrolase